MFFWVEIVVGVTLLALLVTWIRRERQTATEDVVVLDGEDDLAGDAFR